MTPNNSSIYGCQQASDFASAHSLLFLQKIYDEVMLFRRISGVFICEFSICPTHPAFAQLYAKQSQQESRHQYSKHQILLLTQLCTKSSRQIVMQHRNHQLLRGKRPQFRCHFCRTEKARKTDLSIFRVSNTSY